jgi:AcrR family transcriptional regulator
MSTKKQTRKGVGKRFNRRLWMETALEVLASGGSAKLRVDQIARALGVTKGSFYAHFKSREDFLLSVVKYWDDEYNHRVKRIVKASGGSARDQLRRIVEIVSGEKLSRYDLAVSSWAAHEPAIAPIVRRDYQFRLNYVGSLFKQAGFRGVQLQARTEAFVGFMTFRGSFLSEAKGGPSRKALEAWLDFFLRP